MYLSHFSHCADIFKALAHPRRLEIVYLLEKQSLTVGEIFAMLDLPQANVSQHLAILKEAKIVLAEKQGKQINYRLNEGGIIKACDQVRNFLAKEESTAKLFAQPKNPLQNILPLAHDPVCHMQVSSKNNDFVYQYEGKNYYFCASGCLKKFQKEPEKYVKD